MLLNKTCDTASSTVKLYYDILKDRNGGFSQTSNIYSMSDDSEVSGNLFYTYLLDHIIYSVKSMYYSTTLLL